jgi:hypothetical protein
MANKKPKLRKFTVRLFASLPTSATLVVEAENEEAAREYAEEHFAKADWGGPDGGNTPSGGEAKEIQ